jgi:hypothetical protein
MAFVPPLFTKLGKSADDLFTKKYAYKNTLAVKNKSKTGLNFTSGLVHSGKGVDGSLKLKFKKDTFGEAEGEFSTSGTVKGSIKAKKLVKNATFVVADDLKPKEHPKEPTYKAGVEYAQDNVSGIAFFETSFWKNSLVHLAGLVGFDGISVGGEVKANPQDTKNLVDYGVAAQYDHADFSVTGKTLNKFADLEVKGLYKISADHQVGVAVTKKIQGGSGNDDAFALGTECKIDAITKVKAKGDTKGILSAVLEHRLKNPNLLLTTASSFDANNLKNGNFTAKDFGVSVLFGDYEDDD